MRDSRGLANRFRTYLACGRALQLPINFSLRLLAWDGESEELPDANA